MASRQVVLKIEKNGTFVNAEKYTNDDEEEHPGTLTIDVDGDETLAKYRFTSEDGKEKVQYFRREIDGETWKGYLYDKTGAFDNNGGVDNIFKFEDPAAGAAAGDGAPYAMDGVPGGSRKKSKKSKSKKSKRKTKGGKKQKKQSKSRKQRR